MKNLIEEIHELKDYENYDYDQAITDVEILLNQYNIITAPKTIKLSEVIEKLNEIYNDSEFSREVYFNKELNAIGYGEYDKIWFMNTWTGIALIKNNKISKILKITSEKTKWLYALWIAGTQIEDDLECDG